MLAGLGVDVANDVVSASERDLGPVGRPARTVDCVEGDGDREQQLAFGNVPDLNLSHPSGPAAGDRQPSAVRRKPDRLDSLGQADQARQPLRAIAAGQEHFVEPGDGEHLAVGRIVKRRDYRRPGVDGRVIHVIAGPRVLRCIVECSFRDPPLDQLDLGLRQGLLSPGHLGLAAVGRDLIDQVALFGFPGNDGDRLRLAAAEHSLEGRHHIAAARLRRLVATLAAGLKDRADLLVITHRRGRCRLPFGVVATRLRSHQGQDQQRAG